MVYYPDGLGLTSSLALTSNVFNHVFRGTVDANTIDVQVDVNGVGFVSDPTLVGLSVPTFTVPNLSSFPNGLPLDKGLNVIRLRAVDLSGSISPVSTITVNVQSDVEIGVIQGAPTGVQMGRRASSVEISWSDFTTPDAVGYNVYASTEAGGAGSGYLRVNASVIPSTSPRKTVVETFPVNSFTYDFTKSESLDLQIVARTVNPVSGSVVEQLVVNTVPFIQNPSVRYSTSVDALRTSKDFVFSHDRNASVVSGILNNDVFSSIASDEPLFYVVTAVYFDKATGTMQESRFSSEMAGAPLALDGTIRGVRIRDQARITQDYIVEVQKKEPTLSLIPGSTVREVHIEPFSNEMQKAYFLMDWVHRSKSMAAMLAIDDPGLSGTSVPVRQSAYKQNLKTALSISDDTAVQAFIDGSFDILASSFGRRRGDSKPAVVTQTFYTTTKPVKDLIVTQGAVVSSSKDPNAPRFVSNGAVILSADNSLAHYNSDARRYEVMVQMVADVPGEDGNVPAGSLDTISSGADGLRTVNEFSADFGRNRQNNLELAEATQNALSSLDTGTDGGYRSTVFGTPGVSDVKVIQAGDALMVRDYDPVRRKHIGGKVDLYVKGTVERTIVETFSFQFSVADNVRFDVIDPVNLILRARDSRLTTSNPIQEVLDDPARGFGVRNHSNYPTTPYDLTGVSIIDYRTIQLNTLIPQPSTMLDDFVEGDYRFRSNNKLTLSVQPVRRVTSVVGTASGPLDADFGFKLFKLEDPLLYGESTQASDYVTIQQVDGIPSGQSILVNGEEHVLIGEFGEPLESIGVNVFTLKVLSKDRLTVFNGPDSPNPDYLVIPGTQTKPLMIVRSTSSAIATGSTVSVDYEHDENFVVTYVVNDVVQRVQERVDKMRHVAADSLVKQAIENPMATEATIQLLPKAVQSVTDAAVRTAVSGLLNRKGVGNTSHQSDMSGAMEKSVGVDYIVQPFTRLTLQDGALRVRDHVLSDYVFLPTLSQSVNAVYVLTQELPFSTMDGGGSVTVHHGVYMDGLRMEDATTLESVGLGVNRAYIVGRNGAVIPGYSDDATLYPLFIVPSAVALERLRRTANRVILSLNAGVSPPDAPSNHSFSVTYTVVGDSGSKDLGTSDVEYLSPGSLTITWKKAP